MTEYKVTNTENKNSLLYYITQNSKTENIYKKLNSIYPKFNTKSSITIEITILCVIALFSFFYFVTPLLIANVSTYIKG